MLIKLSKPVTYEKKEYTEVVINLEDLSAGQLERIKADYLKLYGGKSKEFTIEQAQMRGTPFMVALDDKFKLFMAQNCSEFRADFFESWCAKDYLKLLRQINLFFSDSSEASEMQPE